MSSISWLSMAARTRTSINSERVNRVFEFHAFCDFDSCDSFTEIQSKSHPSSPRGLAWRAVGT